MSKNTILVLHAGSGIAADDIHQAIKNGIANIHISTELRVAFRQGLEDSLKQNPHEYAPYKLDQKAVEDMKKIVVSKIRLFGAENKCYWFCLELMLEWVFVDNYGYGY